MAARYSKPAALCRPAGRRGRRRPWLSAAGRVLLARSRAQRTTRNDADRLRKDLARFGLDFEAIRR